MRTLTRRLHLGLLLFLAATSRAQSVELAITNVAVVRVADGTLLPNPIAAGDDRRR